MPDSFNTADSANMTGNTKLRVFTSDTGNKTKTFSGTVTVPLTLKNDTDSAKTMYGNYVFFAGFRKVGAYQPNSIFNLTLTDIGYASYEDDYYAEINAFNCTYTHNQTITPGSDYNATITANTGYILPSTITVKCGGTTMSTDKYTWNSSTGKLSIASKNITGGIVVTANGVPNKCNITYSGLDGASLTTKPTTHTYGTATSVGNPTKTGYTFAGWKVNGSTNAQTNLTLGATAYTANITLEASWAINKYNAALSGSNITSTDFGTKVVTYKTEWTGTLTAASGYVLPNNITVTVDGTALATSKYTYNKSTGKITIPAANVTGAITVTADGHKHSYTSKVTTEATCTTDGVRTYTCSGCGNSYTEAITKTGHNYSTEWTTSTTQHWHLCTTCGAADIKSSHVWNEGIVTTEPTETSKGVKTFTCKTCPATKTEPIAMLEHKHHIDPDNWNGHDDDEHWLECEDDCGEKVDHEAHTLVETAHKDPTCTEDGYTKYVCEVCQNEVIKEIEAKGHDFGSEWEYDGTNHYHVCTVCHIATSGTDEHKCDSETVDTLPDCTNAGVRIYECTVCKATKRDEITVDIDAHDWSNWKIVTDPSMESKGTIQSVCNINSDHIKTQEIPSLTDKSFWELIDSTEPTCTENGAEIYECEYGQVTVAIPAKGHTPVNDERVEPTCDSTGLTEGSHCTVCGESIDEQEVINELGHDWDKEGEITTQPNCTEKGSKTFGCKRCDATYTEDVPAKRHTEVTDSAVNATCTETGLTEGKHCSECDVVIVEQEVIKPLGHDWIK